MDAYLTITHEIQKSRLADPARKGRREGEPSPTGGPPATGKERTPRRTPRG